MQCIIFEYADLALYHDNQKVIPKKMTNVLKTSGCIIEEQIGYYDANIAINGLSYTLVEDQNACARLSLKTHGSYFWSYVPVLGDCYVKATNLDPRPNAYAVSGNRECGRN